MIPSGITNVQDAPLARVTLHQILFFQFGFILVLQTNLNIGKHVSPQ